MIESLIDYIQKQGYEVRVFPGCLCIRKIAKGMQFGYDWAISQIDLAFLPWEVLTDEADHRLAEIERAIMSYSPVQEVSVEG